MRYGPRRQVRSVTPRASVTTSGGSRYGWMAVTLTPGSTPPLVSFDGAVICALPGPPFVATRRTDTADHDAQNADSFSLSSVSKPRGIKRACDTASLIPRRQMTRSFRGHPRAGLNAELGEHVFAMRTASGGDPGGRPGLAEVGTMRRSTACIRQYNGSIIPGSIWTSNGCRRRIILPTGTSAPQAPTAMVQWTAGLPVRMAASMIRLLPRPSLCVSAGPPKSDARSGHQPLEDAVTVAAVTTYRLPEV